MTSRRQEVIVATSLHNVGGRPPIDLKTESQIPSKVRSSQNNKTPPRLSGGSSDRGCANKNKNQEECIGGAVSWLHGLTLRSGLALGECGVNRFWISLSRLRRGKTFPASHFASPLRG